MRRRDDSRTTHPPLPSPMAQLKKFTDEEVWSVVEQARLKEYAESEAKKNHLKNPLLMPVCAATLGPALP